MLAQGTAMACDVFVSYAHRDNLSVEGLGFVSRLVKNIKVQAAMKYGRDIDIWWDEDLASGTQWNEQIRDQLNACRIFMPVVSPSWTNSKWAGQEWEAVWKRVADDKIPGHQTRIIPISFELSKGFTSSLPEQVRSLQFRRRFWNVMPHEEFNEAVNALSEDISKLLTKLDELT